MFEDLKDLDLDFSPKYVDDPFYFIVQCIRDAYYDHDYISKDDYLYVLSKFKMLYDNWFHGDN